MAADRYEPLPGLLEIPGWLLRKVPPERRRAVVVAVALAAAGLVAALVLVAVDAARDESRRTAAGERTRAERAAERRVRDQRAATPQTGSGPAAAGLEGEEALRARRRLVAGLEAAVTADARARAQRGELAGAAERTSCSRYPKSLDAPPPQDDLRRRTAVFECIAALEELGASEQTSGSLIGHPFRARVDFERGRYAWCRIVQRPGELSFQAEPLIKVPRACGGS